MQVFTSELDIPEKNTFSFTFSVFFYTSGDFRSFMNFVSWIIPFQKQYVFMNNFIQLFKNFLCFMIFIGVSESVTKVLDRSRSNLKTCKPFFWAEFWIILYQIEVF